MEVECKIFITSQNHVYKTMLPNNLSFLTTDFLADIDSVKLNTYLACSSSETNRNTGVVWLLYS